MHYNTMLIRITLHLVGGGRVSVCLSAHISKKTTRPNFMYVTCGCGSVFL